jgi:hypothetical protein
MKANISQLNQLEQLIDNARDSGADCELRRFAVWCALQTEPSGTRWSYVIDRAEQYALGQVPFEELKELRQSLAGASAAAALIGLRHNATNAATLLAAMNTLAPDAAVAARAAAELQRKWVQMRAENQGASYEWLETIEAETITQQTEMLISML